MVRTKSQSSFGSDVEDSFSGDPRQRPSQSRGGNTGGRSSYSHRVSPRAYPHGGPPAGDEDIVQSPRGGGSPRDDRSDAGSLHGAQGFRRDNSLQQQQLREMQQYQDRDRDRERDDAGDAQRDGAVNSSNNGNGNSNGNGNTDSGAVHLRPLTPDSLPRECLGLAGDVYEYLHAATRGGARCGVRVPDTVIISSSGRVAHWYFTSKKTGKLLRKNKANCTTDGLLKAFLGDKKKKSSSASAAGAAAGADGDMDGDDGHGHGDGDGDGDTGGGGVSQGSKPRGSTQRRRGGKKTGGRDGGASVTNGAACDIVAVLYANVYPPSPSGRGGGGRPNGDGSAADGHGGETTPGAAVATTTTSSSTSQAPEKHVQVHYFDAAGLRQFLTGPSKRAEGVLQRFVEPLGARHAVLQATWTPRLFLLEERTNVNKLSDRRKSMYERAVTFEGAEYHSRSDTKISATTNEGLRRVCTSIARHLYYNTHGPLSVRYMTAHFKVGRDNRLYFLWMPQLKLSLEQVPERSAAAAATPLAGGIRITASAGTLPTAAGASPQPSYNNNNNNNSGGGGGGGGGPPMVTSVPAGAATGGGSGNPAAQGQAVCPSCGGTFSRGAMCPVSYKALILYDRHRRGLGPSTRPWTMTPATGLKYTLGDQVDKVVSDHGVANSGGGGGGGGSEPRSPSSAHSRGSADAPPPPTRRRVRKSTIVGGGGGAPLRDSGAPVVGGMRGSSSASRGYDDLDNAGDEDDKNDAGDYDVDNYNNHSNNRQSRNGRGGLRGGGASPGAAVDQGDHHQAPGGGDPNSDEIPLSIQRAWPALSQARYTRVRSTYEFLYRTALLCESCTLEHNEIAAGDMERAAAVLSMDEESLIPMPVSGVVPNDASGHHHHHHHHQRRVGHSQQWRPPPPYQQIQQQYGAGGVGGGAGGGSPPGGGHNRGRPRGVNPHPVHGRQSYPVSLPPFPTAPRTNLRAPPPYAAQAEADRRRTSRGVNPTTAAAASAPGPPGTIDGIDAGAGVDGHGHGDDDGDGDTVHADGTTGGGGDRSHHHHRPAPPPPWTKLSHIRSAAPPPGLVTSLDLLEPADAEERKSLLAMQAERVKAAERGGAVVRVRLDTLDDEQHQHQHQQHNNNNNNTADGEEELFGGGEGNAMQGFDINEDILDGMVRQERAILEAALRSGMDGGDDDAWLESLQDF